MRVPPEFHWIASGLAILAWGSGVSGTALAQGPSYSCTGAAASSIEEMICNDSGLAELDRKLADVYSEALRKTPKGQSATLKAEQRGWIKGRNDCWKKADKRACVEEEYKRRIAELQARYNLASSTSPTVFTCDGQQGNELVATFFQTDPPTLIAEYGGNISLMHLQPAASGAKYQGRNEVFWEHHGEALVTWGYGAPDMRCKKAR